MKRFDFEIFTLIFALIPTIFFFTVMNRGYIISGVIVTLISLGFSLINRRKEDEFSVIPNNLINLSAITIFFPLLLSFLGFYFYENISDAYWIFFLCCWALGAAIGGFIDTHLNRKSQ